MPRAYTSTDSLLSFIFDFLTVSGVVTGSMGAIALHKFQSVAKTILPENYLRNSAQFGAENPPFSGIYGATLKF